MHSTLDRISSWMSRQSWYVHAGDGIPRLRELAEVFLPSSDPGSRVRILVVRDETPESPIVYQLPIVERDIVPSGAEPHLIGRGYGGAAIYDGVGDPAYAAALLAGLRESGGLADDRDARPLTSFEVLSADGAAAQLEVSPFGRDQLRLTVYRRVLPGGQPDALARTALSDAGLAFMPRVAGSLEVSWTDEDGWRESAHLAVLRDDEPGSLDGWTLAVEAARAGSLFVKDARQLGESLARTHAALRRLLPSRTATVDELSSTFGTWRRRLEAAEAVIPGISAVATEIEDCFARAAGLPSWPALQTVHGSLDLLSTVRSPAGVWSFRDFGGADPAPAVDRVDVALHDVVAVLRSFAYAAALAGGPDDGWDDDVRGAFLAGYEAVAGVDALPTELLDALELDLALFDAGYEARTRPEHLGIPLAAIARITGIETERDERDAA